jgi:hypothetical protein
VIKSAGAGEAVDANGNLKDAEDMVWYNDKDDTVPIPSGSNPPRMFSTFIKTVYLLLSVL